MQIDSPFAPFEASFVPTSSSEGPFPAWNAKDTVGLVGRDVPAFTTFVQSFLRTSFRDGAIRFFPPSDLSRWNGPNGWKEAWPRWAKRLVVFASDWVGRQIAFDLSCSVGGEPGIATLDTSTGQLLELPDTNFSTFLNKTLVEHDDEVVLTDLFAEWIATNESAPSNGQCVGYVEPLFLGGSDDLANMQLTDMDVYISITAQLFHRVEHLPAGTPIGSVRIS